MSTLPTYILLGTFLRRGNLGSVTPRLAAIFVTFSQNNLYMDSDLRDLRVVPVSLVTSCPSAADISALRSVRLKLSLCWKINCPS